MEHPALMVRKRFQLRVPLVYEASGHAGICAPETGPQWLWPAGAVSLRCRRCHPHTPAGRPRPCGAAKHTQHQYGGHRRFTQIVTLYYTWSTSPLHSRPPSQQVLSSPRRCNRWVSVWGTGSLCQLCPHCLPAKAARGCMHAAEAGPALMLADLGPLHLDHPHICQGLQQNTAMGAWMLAGTQLRRVVGTVLNVWPKVRHLQLEACVRFTF